jgi:hypothetical protein
MRLTMAVSSFFFPLIHEKKQRVSEAPEEA